MPNIQSKDIESENADIKESEKDQTDVETPENENEAFKTAKDALNAEEEQSPDKVKPEDEKQEEAEDQITDEKPQYVVDLEGQVSKAKEQIESLTRDLQESKQIQQQQQAARPLSPEERVQVEKDWGYERMKDAEGNEVLHIDPWKQINSINMKMARAYTLIHDNLKKEMDSEISVFKQESLFGEFERQGVNDIRKYRDEIKQYLDKFYPGDASKYYSADHVAAAYYYFKGKRMPETVKKVISDNEMHKKIVRPTKPSTKSEKSGREMTDLDRRLMELDGTFKDDAEWNKYKNVAVKHR